MLGTAWGIVGLTLIALMLMEGSLRVIFWAKDLRGIPPVPDPRVLELGYRNEPWAVDHFRELGRLEDRWQPFVYFRQKSFEGQTIHVDAQGHRAVWQPSKPLDSGSKPIKVVFLGGSSLWGFGARDDHTIPSYVARMFHERGISVEVRNLSEIGYVNTQELIALIGDLQAGDRPDYVVFYDGVNDTTSALLDGTAGVSTNDASSTSSIRRGGSRRGWRRIISRIRPHSGSRNRSAAASGRGSRRPIPIRATTKGIGSHRMSSGATRRTSS